MTAVVVQNQASVVPEVVESEYIVNNTETPTVQEVVSSEFITQETTNNVVLYVDNKEVIQAGQQGPRGVPGIAEEDVVYSKRIDFISDDVLYKGEAAVGSSESNTVWRIRKITVSPDGDVTEVWANGSADFTHSWTGRTGYTYS